MFSGYATTVESIVGHISGDMENPDLGPTKFDCDAANQTLDELGYKKGSDGIRVAPATTGKDAQPAHPMKYEILQPTSLDFNGERAFDIVKEGFANAGVDVTLKVGGDATATYALETGDTCDVSKNPPVGYDGFDIAMWDWVGYVDPDFMLSVVTRGQWCSWSDTGWINDEYDKLYKQQGVTVDRDAAQADRLRDAADRLRRLPVHPAGQRAVRRCERQDVDELQDDPERVLEGVLHLALQGQLT